MYAALTRLERDAGRVLTSGLSGGSMAASPVGTEGDVRWTRGMAD